MAYFSKRKQDEMTDLIQMFNNLSRSLPSVQKLLGATGYLFGIILITNGVYKFKDVINKSSHDHITRPIALILSGASLLFLPTMINVWSQTFFGIQSPLEYSTYSPPIFIASIDILIRTAGIVWFIKGCMLLAHSGDSNAEKDHGTLKAVVAMIAGIMAININATVSWLQGSLNYLMNVMF